MLKYIKDKLRPGSFSRNVLDLITGSVLSQAIIALSAPILTRLYSPDEFGLLALYITIVSIGSVVMCWRYELAVVLPDEEDDALNLVFLATTITAGMTIFSFLIFFVGQNLLADVLATPAITPWLLLVPVSLGATGLYNVLNYWYSRKKKFRLIAISRIGLGVSTVGIQIGSRAVVKTGMTGLIGGQIIGRVIAVLILFIEFMRKDWVHFIGSISRFRLKTVASQYRKYPVYSTWPAFIDTFTMSLPVLFITKYLGAELLGYFAISMRVLQVPMTFIGASIGQVYFQELAREKNRTDDISKLVEKTFLKLLVIALPIGAILMFAGPVLFSIVFGREWAAAGEIARILAPAMALRFATSPLTTVFGVLNRQEISAIWQVGALICTSAALFIGLSFDNNLGVIYALAVNDLVIYTVYLMIVFGISKASFRRALNLAG